MKTKLKKDNQPASHSRKSTVLKREEKIDLRNDMEDSAGWMKEQLKKPSRRHVPVKLDR